MTPKKPIKDYKTITRVKGYEREDGTKVKEHQRKVPYNFKW